MSNNSIPFFDVVVVGAGLSGIGAAYHVQHKCPDLSLAVLEGRGAMGGTWDLFRYPGIRSDSDMYTLGFSFYPWKDPKAIADGPSILSYIKETAAEFGIDKKIRYHHKVVDANWSDEAQLWTLQMAEHESLEAQQLQCRFLFMCSGYYNYEEAYNPPFPNSEVFQGQVIHPQYWTPDIEYAGKKVVVIGSGATAVTLVPEMAKTAESVVMLQRSPTYIMNLPREDAIANFLKRVLPMQWAHTLSRWKNILFGLGFYKVSKRWPDAIRRFIQKGVRKELGDDYDMRHFDPKYDPWDQRLCLIPDSDLFLAINNGSVEVVTDTIETFTETGIRLDSGEALPADLIVTATGLKIQLMGGMTVRKNDEVIDFAKLHSYRGVLMSNLPNFAVAVGYTNASWTLKCDLNCHYVTRVLNHMQRNGHAVCTPRFDPEEFATEPLLDFDAGYIQRALHVLPKQGSAPPWKVYQNYLKDTRMLKYGKVDDRYLEYV